MTSYIRKPVVCKHCGKEYLANILSSTHQFRPSDLDLNPHNPAIYDEVIMCPHCKYVTTRIYEEVTKRKAQLVESEAYKKIWETLPFPNTVKKLLAAAYLEQNSENWRKAGHYYLKASWYLKERNVSEEKTMREIAVQCFKVYLEENQDEECAILYIDCLRQLSRFEEAMEMTEFLLPYLMEKEFLRKIVLYEQTLIKAKDSAAHSMGEV